MRSWVTSSAARQTCGLVHSALPAASTERWCREGSVRLVSLAAMKILSGEAAEVEGRVSEGLTEDERA